MTISTREQLDRISVGACASGGDHSANGVMFLHSRCHTRAPFFLEKHPGVIRAVCVDPECNKTIVELPDGDIRLLDGSQFPGIFAQGCHPDSAVWLSYRFGSGLVDVVCYECQSIVAQIGVPKLDALSGKPREGE